MPGIITRGAMSAKSFGFLGNTGGDPYFSSVTLLMEAAAGGVADLSSHAATITANNGAATSATQSKFNSLSYSLLNGGAENGYFTGNYSGAFAVGAGPWTMETWIWVNTLANRVDIFSSKSAAAATVFQWQLNSSGKLILQNQTVDKITSTSAVSTSAWTHIAITNDGTTLRQFINGTVDATTAADTTNWVGDTTGRVGYNVSFGAHAGYYFDQARITVGVARYTATFTAPTAPFPTH